MPPLSVTIPPEPDIRAVVLDRDALAWQRSDEGTWWPCDWIDGEEPSRSWSHLLVERGPLAPLVTEAEEEPTQAFRAPIEARPRHERTDATAGDCATSRRGAEDDGLPRSWSVGDAEPEGVATVRDNDSRTWHRGEGDELHHAWRTEDHPADDASWLELVDHHGPVTEQIARPDAEAAALPPQGRFVEATEPAPLVGGRAFGGFAMPAPGPLPAHLRRAVVDRPQA